jgi:hypothetical protein
MAAPLLSLVVTGRNDDYGGGFAARLFRTMTHNLARLRALGSVEVLFVEWNPVPERPWLARDLVARVPDSRALVVSAACHARFSRNVHMPFHEMAAKNVGIRRARGEWVLAANADILIDDRLGALLNVATLREDTIYRAQRVDLTADAPWHARHDPAWQLPSGEGYRPPPPCFGAAGDFCLAHRRLWHELRGYNERVRFSTRAKDWQFLLSAARRSVPIVFLGHVFHVDHEGGFQRAAEATRDTETAHFGGPWDVEYGLPVLNRDDWGLAACGVQSDPADPRITLVTPSAAWGLDDAEDDALRVALSGPHGGKDDDTALLMHAIAHAAAHGRRVLADLTRDADLVRFAGLAQVAAAYGVDVRSRQPPPAFLGHTAPTLHPWQGAGAPGDVVVRRQGALRVVTATGEPLPVLPSRLPSDAPRFDPILARRLLATWLRLQRDGARTFMLFGAGSHTRAVLRWGWPDGFACAGIVASRPDAASACGLPLVSLEACPPDAADTLVLSSLSYETDLLAAARARGWRRIVSLYEHPPGAPPAPPWMAGLAS